MNDKQMKKVKSTDEYSEFLIAKQAFDDAVSDLEDVAYSNGLTEEEINQLIEEG